MKRVVGVLALVALLVPAIAAARSTGTLRMTAFFSSPSVPTSCQPGASPETSCWALRASASVRGLGNTRLEGIQATTDPGFHVRVTGRLLMANKGTLEFEADNSQTSREVILTVRITGGTGVFVGASGSGTYQMDGRTNTTSLWDVELTAPGYEFDVRPPRLAVSTPSARPRGGSCLVRVPYRANDERAGSLRVSLLGGARRISSSKPSGVLSITVRRAPRLRLTLVATDASANTARRSVAVRC